MSASGRLRRALRHTVRASARPA